MFTISASSPAQAAAAPYLNDSVKKDFEDSPRIDGFNKALKVEPVVVIKPMSDEVGTFTIRISIRRLVLIVDTCE